MDIQKLREEFEKLPEIKMVLIENTDIKFEGDNYVYHGLDTTTALATMFVFGAWYAFQEQQKQINEIKAIAESWINQDYTHNSGSTDIKIQQMKDCGRDIIRKINGE